MELKFSKPNRARIGYQLAVLSFGRFRTALNLLRDIGEIGPRYLARGLFVFVTSLVTTPLRVIERVAHGRAVDATQVDPAPIFIVGHWRSGTTHLHNLMAQDPNLGFVSMYQAIVPGFSLLAERVIKPVLSRLVPLARPMDGMVWPLDSPQEEEIPLSKTYHQGFYTRLLFPHTLAESMDEQVLLRGATERATRTWRSRYLDVLRKATYRCAGRRLVLKNPVNTGRIPLLLEMFPNAKFIFVHRNPYEVFLSTRRLHESLLDIVALQGADREVVEENVLDIYQRVMRRFLEDRSRIPKGNLVEVRFEDLARGPHAELKRIYETLDLPGFDAAEPSMGAYIDSQAGYRPAEYDVDTDTMQKVDGAWGFAFDALDYRRGSECGDRRAEPPRPRSPLPLASSRALVAQAGPA